MKNKREVRTFAVTGLEIRKADGDGKRDMLVGHAAVFNSESVDFGGWKETIRKGAFKRAIKEKQDVRALLNHDSNFVLGRTKSGTLRLKEDKEGLYVEIDLPNTTAARDLKESIDRGDIDQMSFAFRVGEDDWKEKKDDEGSLVYLRELKEIETLYDVSPVTFPAYQQTDIAVRGLEQFKESSKRGAGLRQKSVRARLEAHAEENSI